MTTADLVEKYIREQTRLKMNEETFALLDSILEFGYSAKLMVTRGSVGDTIVAVMKARTEND